MGEERGCVRVVCLYVALYGHALQCMWQSSNGKAVLLQHQPSYQHLSVAWGGPAAQ